MKPLAFFLRVGVVSFRVDYCIIYAPAFQNRSENLFCCCAFAQINLCCSISRVMSSTDLLSDNSCFFNASPSFCSSSLLLLSLAAQGEQLSHLDVTPPPLPPPPPLLLSLTTGVSPVFLSSSFEAPDFLLRLNWSFISLDATCFLLVCRLFYLLLLPSLLIVHLLFIVC